MTNSHRSAAAKGRAASSRFAVSTRRVGRRGGARRAWSRYRDRSRCRGLRTGCRARSRARARAARGRSRTSARRAGGARGRAHASSGAARRAPRRARRGASSRASTSPLRGRPADDDEQRRRVRAQPGQQVVVELVDREAEVLARERRAGQVEREPRGGEPLPQDLQRLDEPRGRRGARRDPAGARRRRGAARRGAGRRDEGRRGSARPDGPRRLPESPLAVIPSVCRNAAGQARWDTAGPSPAPPRDRGARVETAPARVDRDRTRRWAPRRVTPPGGAGATRPRPRPAPAGTRAGAGCPAAPGRART